MMRDQRYIDPTLLAQVKNLYLAARYVAEGAIGGFHKSPYVGYNAEFSHHREYQPGDDLRHIDWKRFGKSGKYYVKQYEESSSLNAMILLDQSESMRYPKGVEMNKESYSKILIASIAYLLLHQRDGVGFLSFGEQVNRLLPISSRMTQFSSLVNALNDDGLHEKRADLFEAVQSAVSHQKKKCMFILVSDFLDMDEKLLEALRMIRYYKHEVLAFHVLSREELGFPFDGFHTFLDMETGEEVSLEARSIKDRYKKNLEHYLGQVKSLMHQLSIDYQLFDTSIPLEKALIHFLYNRSRHA